RRPLSTTFLARRTTSWCSSTRTRSALPLPSFNRLGEVPGSGGELPEGLCDSGHAHAGAGSAERFDGIVEALPDLGRCERTAPRGRAQLLGRKPSRPGSPAKPLLLGVAIGGLLLGGSIGERPQPSRIA